MINRQQESLLDMLRRNWPDKDQQITDMEVADKKGVKDMATVLETQLMKKREAIALQEIAVEAQRQATLATTSALEAEQ